MHGRVYNLYLLFISMKLYEEFNIECAINGHYYKIESIKNKKHNITILVYRKKCRIYIATYYDNETKEMMQYKYKTDGDVIFDLINLVRIRG